MKGFLPTLFGQGGKMFLQILYILGLAMILPTDQYGEYAIIASLVVVFGPFCGLGYGNLLIKDISNGSKNYSALLLRFIISLLSSYGVLQMFLLIVMFCFFDANGLLIVSALLLGIADILFLRISEVTSQVELAKQNFKKSSFIQIAISLTRLSSLGIYLIVNFIFNLEFQLYIWLIIYCILAGTLSIYNFKSILKAYGPIDTKAKKVIKKELYEGVQFSIAISSQGIYNDIDKGILGKYNGTVITGNYAFAYKMIDLLFFPIRALLTYTYPRFFKKGHVGGISSTFSYANKLVLFAFLYNLLASSIFLYVINDIYKLIPQLEKYNLALNMIDGLILVTFLRGIHYFYADSLTGAGYNLQRTLLQVFIAIVNLILSIIFIKYYGWQGAVLSSIISDGLMAMLLLFVNIYYLKKEKK